MKIAIIGAGISGLTAAHRLHADHEMTIFESSDYAGGHAHTVDVESGDEHHAIDTGFVVYNDWTYPHFSRLLNELQVVSRPTSMSFSVQCEAANLEYNGSSLNGLFSQRRNLVRPGHYRMLSDILRFNREAAGDVTISDDVTVRDYLTRHRYSREFADYYLLPMGAAIWSCPLGTFGHFSIRFIIDFFRNHGLLNIRRRPTWRVIEGGSRTYVGKLVERFRDRVRLKTPIERVTRTPDGVDVCPRNHAVERFDHVIFACHSDQALRLLTDASSTERSVLSQFPYVRNSTVLHTDPRVLPTNARTWASWNYFLAGQPSTESSMPASVTYHMNLLQHIDSRRTYNVTLNRDAAICPSHVIRHMQYEHPTFSVGRAAAQARHHELINVNRTSFCGAYWGNGFHEDGVTSAVRVCAAFARQGVAAC